MPFTSQNIERGVNTYKGDVYKDVGDLVDACITGQKCLDEARPELNEMMAKVQMDIRANKERGDAVLKGLPEEDKSQILAWFCAQPQDNPQREAVSNFLLRTRKQTIMTWCGAHGILGEQKNEVMAWVNAQPQFNQCILDFLNHVSRLTREIEEYTASLNVNIETTTPRRDRSTSSSKRDGSTQRQPITAGGEGSTSRNPSPQGRTNGNQTQPGRGNKNQTKPGQPVRPANPQGQAPTTQK